MSQLSDSLKPATPWLTLAWLLVLALLVGLVFQVAQAPRADVPPTGLESPRVPELGLDQFDQQRRAMVDEQLRARGIDDPRVLEAMLRVPRHEFVPQRIWDRAYADAPQPIGHDQTISQPYIVALMTQLVRPQPESRALDVGTGSGYQAAILAELCAEVYSIEILEPLARTAKQRLADLGYRNITVQSGDGYAGWPEQAPFDVIVVAAAPEHVPRPLLEQLAVGGRLVGRFHQQLRLIEKQADGTLRESTVAAVAFVPMTGQAQQRRGTPASTPTDSPASKTD